MNIITKTDTYNNCRVLICGGVESGRFPKKLRCDFKQSIRKNTFFQNSHLSIYKIVMFSYLWTENVYQFFIQKQIDIAPQSIIDRYILRHEKIGVPVVTRYLKKYMFLKSCRQQNVDPLHEFFGCVQFFTALPT